MDGGYQGRTFSARELRQQDQDREAEHAANEEGFIAHSYAEQVLALLDRHTGDWGSDPEIVASIGSRLAGMKIEIEALLGQPKRAIWRDGVLVGLVAKEARQ